MKEPVEEKRHVIFSDGVRFDVADWDDYHEQNGFWRNAKLEKIWIEMRISELFVLGIVTGAIARRNGRPSNVAKLVSIIAGPKLREAMLGDLDESYRKSAERFGERFARQQYIIDAVLTSVALLAGRLVKVLRLAVVGWAMNWVRQKIGH